MPHCRTAGFAAVLITSLLCYLNSLNGDLVHDDRFAIKENMDVRPDTPLWNLFRNDFWGKKMSDPTSHKSYRPLTTLTFRMNYLLHGLRPWGYHAVNVVLHSVSSVLVVAVSWKLLGMPPFAAGMVGMLFATHPVHSEAVCGVVGRADILSCILFQLGLLAYWRSKQCASSGQVLFWLICCGLSGIAATLCKELGITLFGVCWIYDVLHSWNASANWVCVLFKQDMKTRLRWIFLLIVVAVLLGARLHVMAGHLPHFNEEDNPASFSSSLLTRTLTYNYLYAANGQLLLAPLNLCYDWQGGSIPLLEGLGDPRNLQTVAFYLLTLLLCLRGLGQTWKPGPAPSPVLLALALLAVPFLPASNLLFRVGFVLAERVLYLPSIGYCVLIVHGVCRMENWICQRLPPTSSIDGSSWQSSSQSKSSTYLPRIPRLFLLLICGVFAVKTIDRNTVWATRESLFESGVTTLPHNAKAHYNFANFLKDAGNISAAVQHYKQAVRLAPGHVSSHNNLGTMLGPVESEHHLREAIQYNPRHSRAHYNLANLLSDSGRQDEALGHILDSLKLNEAFPDAWSSYAGILLKLERRAEVAGALDRVMELRPDRPEVYCNVASYYEDLGLYERAVKAGDAALSLRPSDPAALRIMGLAHRQLGQDWRAEQCYVRSLKSKADPGTFYLLSALYYNTGRYEEASEAAQQLLSLDPNHLDGCMTHALSLLELGRAEQARSLLEDATVKFPTSPTPFKHMTLLLSKQKKFQQALEYGERAVSLDSQDASILTVLGSVHRELEQYAKAKEVFARVAKLSPNDGSAWLNLGAIEHVMGNLPSAKRRYQKALEYPASRSLARQNLDKVDRLLGKQKSTVL